MRTASGTAGCWLRSPSKPRRSRSVADPVSVTPPARRMSRRAVAFWDETYKIESAYQQLTMDMSLDHPTPVRRFLRTWRRELIRGGVLFTLVLCTGLFIRSVKVRMPSPLGALGAFGDFNWGDGDGGDLFGRGREVGDAWHYATVLTTTQHVWIRNTNGPIDVEPGVGDSLVIEVEKSWRSSSPRTVELVPVLTERGLTVCALWDARARRCGDGGDYRLNGVRKNDVAVRFHVQLPHSIPVDASTVNGALQIAGVSAPVEATTVNGSIDANMEKLTGGDVRLTTVNGSVTAGLPRTINADIDAETVKGRVETDFPIKVSGRMSTRHWRGTIGTGAPTFKLVTVNGSITLHEAVPGMPEPAIAPHPPMHPRRSRTSVPAAPQAPSADH